MVRKARDSKLVANLEAEIHKLRKRVESEGQKLLKQAQRLQKEIEPKALLKQAQDLQKNLQKNLQKDLQKQAETFQKDLLKQVEAVRGRALAAAGIASASDIQKLSRKVTALEKKVGGQAA